MATYVRTGHPEIEREDKLEERMVRAYDGANILCLEKQAAAGIECGGNNGLQRRVMKDPALRACVLAVLAGGWALTLPAQTPVPVGGQVQASPSDHTSNPQLKPNPLELLRKFEPAPDEEYLLGKGDEITIDFTGRSDLQAKLVVGPDGRISLPLAGEIMVAGLTRNDAADAIVKALSPYYANLAAQITVTKYTANRVLVLGAVERPGPVVFDGPPTLLEAITRSQLQSSGPEKRQQVPEECAIYRGSEQVLWVQLRELIESGNPLADLRLRRGDVIYIPDPNERFVSVLGEVQHPGAIPLTHSATLMSVLASSGGITEKAGRKPRIQIIDPKAGTSRTVEFNDLLNPANTLEVTLKPGQVIYVPRSGFAQVSYYLQNLSSVTSLFTMLTASGRL